MSNESLVSVELDGRVATLTITSPPANALSYELTEQLDLAVTTATEAGASVLVIASGLPRFFVAGADLKLLVESTVEEFTSYLRTLRSVIERIASLPQISIAVLDGMALGGGLELAMACTMRIATSKATLGLPEIKLGLLPGAGGTQRLPRLIGRGPALDLLLSGRSVDGQEAIRLGLVDRLIIQEDEQETNHAASQDHMAQVMEQAQALTKQPKLAMAEIVRCVDASDGTFEAGMNFEEAAIGRLFGNADAREGIQAFIEKRQANFR